MPPVDGRVTREPDVHTLDQAIHAVHAWNKRKANLMPVPHVRAAWDRLAAQHWLPQEVACAQV